LEKCIIHLWFHCKRYKWARRVSGEIQVVYNLGKACTCALILQSWVTGSRVWGVNMTSTRSCYWMQFWTNSILASQPIYINSFSMWFSSPLCLPRSFSRTFALVCCYHSVLSGICKPWSSLLCNILNFLCSSSVFDHDIFLRAVLCSTCLMKATAKVVVL
jgi:hypothetical protein